MWPDVTEKSLLSNIICEKYSGWKNIRVHYKKRTAVETLSVALVYNNRSRRLSSALQLSVKFHAHTLLRSYCSDVLIAQISGEQCSRVRSGNCKQNTKASSYIHETSYDASKSILPTTPQNSVVSVFFAGSYKQTTERIYTE